MASTFDTFIRFSTDAYGLERTFRLLQSLTQILLFLSPARTLLFSTLILLSPSKPTALQPLAISALTTLRARFALGRRYFRVGRFLESFQGAWKVYSSGRGTVLEDWLDISAKSFNGMYLLLETATFLDALGVEGLGVWGERVGAVNVEAQRFWFLALVCGVGKGALVVRRLRGEIEGAEEKEEIEGAEEKDREDEKGVEEKRKKRLEVERKRREQLRRIVRRIVADALDIAVPGAVVGWVPLEPGTVGLMMLGSTWLTGLEVWERCGGELELKKT